MVSVGSQHCKSALKRLPSVEIFARTDCLKVAQLSSLDSGTLLYKEGSIILFSKSISRSGKSLFICQAPSS